MVYRYLAGEPLNPGDLAPGPGLAAALGSALAALHEVPRSVVEDSGFPSTRPTSTACAASPSSTGPRRPARCPRAC